MVTLVYLHIALISIVAVFFKAMKKSESDKFLIDGFPRNQDNLDGWNKEMSDKANVQFCLYIDCSEDVSFFLNFEILKNIL